MRVVGACATRNEVLSPYNAPVAAVIELRESFTADVEVDAAALGGAELNGHEGDEALPATHV